MITEQLLSLIADRETFEEIPAELIDEVSGGANCSYLGVYDYSRMQSYSSRNYSC